ncbi:proline dehydrogenase family protein [Desulfovibrio mangrovi]|uniref:proline dehydrogenase family protein n=1 Tax=Desulfovibrio mangrovi TaxID=2976983 RepID=UPI0022481005|nr:proline dehydrogenase family protein [Desulfovibrio mangrovi]UZP66399.1 proline dehydrogenase family protein [Desulfovibrio mangrovi]
MRYWQRAMIYCARHKGLTDAVHGSRFMTRFSRQFVAAGDGQQAVERMARLCAEGKDSSFFYLGEYVESAEEVEATVRALLQGIPLLAAQGLDMHVSVDPTQIGSMLSWELCRENALRLAEAIKQHAGQAGADTEYDVRRSVLMLDMEDSSVTEPTLELFHTLFDVGLPVAVTVQSYLHRSTDDLAALVDKGAMVRLVKGAFAEPASRAHVRRQDVDDAYRLHLSMLFGHQARETGVYPVLGTHDERMVRFGAALAERGGWNSGEWEVEMLLGVRSALQRQLVEQGTGLRLYCPFGQNWWPYSVRRIGENPRNALFVLRSMAGV